MYKCRKRPITWEEFWCVFWKHSLCVFFSSTDKVNYISLTIFFWEGVCSNYKELQESGSACSHDLDHVISRSLCQPWPLCNKIMHFMLWMPTCILVHPCFQWRQVCRQHICHIRKVFDICLSWIARSVSSELPFEWCLSFSRKFCRKHPSQNTSENENVWNLGV